MHNFLDWLMKLPEDVEKQFQIELKALERAEERQKQAIALNMLKDNLPLEQIVRWTGLTIEQVQTLRNQAENDQ